MKQFTLAVIVVAALSAVIGIYLGNQRRKELEAEKLSLLNSAGETPTEKVAQKTSQ